VKILGIPTKIEPSFLMLSLLLAASRGFNPPLLLEWLVVVFISVLLHELGHALVARRFGLSPRITLHSMGGLTSWSEVTEIGPAKHLAIILAGPAAGFFLGGVLYAVGPTLLRTLPAEILAVGYRDLLWVNIGWGIFNLLPILPLDGGQVLRIVERWLTKKQDQIISYMISLLGALAITCLAFTTRSVWVAFLGIWFAYFNTTFLLQRLKTSRDKKLEPTLNEARNLVAAGEFNKALDIIVKIQNKALTQWMRSETARLLIFTLIKQKRYQEAEDELTKYFGLFGPEYLLQGVLSFEKNEMSKAITDLKIAFDKSPDYQCGLILSQALMAEKKYADVLDLCGHEVMSQAILPLSSNLQVDAFKAHEFEISGKAGVLAFQQNPDPNIAYNAGCAFARANDSTLALFWLERAIASGFCDRSLLADDSDLESIRSQPGFARILESISHPTL
jgi:Zn-dependent protease